MSDKNGFTLMELLIVMIIIGILASVLIPGYLTTMNQGAANAAEHNLITIYNAQQSYYFANNAYCTSSTGAVANCGSNLGNLNTNLGTLDEPNAAPTSLNIADSYFSYICTRTSRYQCTATNATTGVTLTLTLTNPIVLPGSSNTLNPSCNSSKVTNCPTN